MAMIILIFQVILSLIFFFAGGMKLIHSYDKLNERMKWTQNYSIQFIRLLAVAELLGAIGLFVSIVVPSLELISFISGIGLAVVMVGAPITHLKLGEQKEAAITSLLFILLALVVVYNYIF